MDIKINNEIKLSAARCSNNFSCLSQNTRDLCKIKKHVGETVYFIACKDDKYCSYKESFGKQHICCCLVRNEIYDKYKI